MLKLRILSLPTFGLALVAAAVLLAHSAQAGDRRSEREGGAALGPLQEPVGLAEEGLFVGGDPDTTAYDIPGEILVDARDDLDGGGLSALARDFGLVFRATALERETKEELAHVSIERLAEVVDKLSHDPRVELVEPLAYVRAFFSADDPLLRDQWHMDRIGAPRAWDFATGRGATVAIVDTGIACETYGSFSKGSDLAGTRCVAGWNFVASNEHANDDQGHGTHVAGTVAQSTNNGIGAAGIAFHARLMPVKVLNESGWGTTADVADGIRWAAEHGAQVINLSLGGPRNSGVLQKAIRYAVSQGAVVVAAAGNTGGRVQYPGASDGVIGVSATDADDKIAKFSSRGSGVDLAAPGVNIVQQTICNKGRDKCERYSAYNGTSMAAPHVAGAAALLVGLGVTAPSAVEDALKSGARVVDSSESGKALYGAGILFAASAVEHVTWNHALVRILALFGVTLLLGRRFGKRNGIAKRRFGVGYWLFAMAAGPGLLFFAPWMLPRVHLAVDLLSRPFADYDFFAGAAVHRWLPLANAAIPFGLTALAFGVRAFRAPIAGFAAGTAAYLASAIVLHEIMGPFGHVPLALWCAVNAVVCLWIARVNLAEST